MACDLRSRVRILTLAAIAACGAMVGCDRSEGSSDKQVRSELRTAFDQHLVGGPDAMTTAQKSLTSAAGVTTASPAMRAIAKGSLADSELETAISYGGKVDELELQLAEISSEITQLATQVRATGSAVAGYKKFDPQPARQAIEMHVAEAQGASDKPAWMTTGNMTIPALSTARQDVTKTEGEINQLQEQKNNLQAEHDKLLDDANAAFAQSDQSKGAESVETFKKASDLRKQAGMKQIGIDQLNVQIGRQQQTLVTQQGQSRVVEEAVSELQKQSAALDAGWTELNGQLAKQQQFASQILGGGSESAVQTVAYKANEFGKLLKQIAELRASAVENGSDAVKDFGEAYTAAEAERLRVQTEIDLPSNAGRPELQAWKDLIEAIDPMRYRLKQAAAQRALGGLYLAQTASASRRAALQETVGLATKSVGKDIPEELQGDFGKTRENALAQASSSYKDSESLLTDIIEGRASESLQTAARLSRALTLYGASLVDELKGDSKAAADHIAAAASDRSAVAEHGVPIPSLPSELGGSEGSAATSKPTSAEATAEPTTAPSTVPPQ